MKNQILLVLAFSFFSIHFQAQSQGLKGMFNEAKQKYLPSNSLSNADIGAGLKEALEKGVNNGTQKLSSPDGFLKDAAVKVLLPPEAKPVEDKLRSVGLGSQVDEAIVSMNRGAEEATKSAAPIFIDAIKKMNIEDAIKVLKGGDLAATNYLKENTSTALTAAFRPIIESSLNKVNATKYWSTIINTYNKFSFQKINPDLAAYVTEKALAGIFYQIGLEEQKIRKDPASRTSDLLKKVFK